MFLIHCTASSVLSSQTTKIADEGLDIETDGRKAGCCETRGPGLWSGAHHGLMANTDITSQPVSSSNESLQFSGEQVAGADTRKCSELGPCSSAQGD